MAIQKSIEKDDLLTRMRVREVLLFGLIAMAAVLAQLPAETLDDYGIDRNWLLGVLGMGIVIGLFFYLRFFFFLAVVLLILGANLDQQLADYVDISKIPLVLALVAMVGISLINYVIKLMPTGLEPKTKEKSPEGIRALFYAIEKSNLVYAQKVLMMNFDPNVQHDNGYTALAYAAMKGNGRLVELLLRNGADPNGVTKEGDTAVELALRLGHSEVADLLKAARQQAMSAAEPQAEAKAA
ncbi:MAG: ankyrin repeat domain-containing protein [Betaproteobacteria bacterium]|nr:ankyrin repeat domain-containing protein [Betaproteobacteria bacterium]